MRLLLGAELLHGLSEAMSEDALLMRACQHQHEREKDRRLSFDIASLQVGMLLEDVLRVRHVMCDGRRVPKRQPIQRLALQQACSVHSHLPRAVALHVEQLRG